MKMVVHCKRDYHDVYIGRPSKWGNPFSHLDLVNSIKCESREEAVNKYREWIKTQPRLLKALPELKNKILGCWCAPKACHGDVLVELINEYYP